MASTPTKQPALKVFGIPELAHAICAGNRRRDNASLMQTRRLFFCSLLPFVWDEVDEPDRLVSMIPGGGVVAGDPDLPLLLVMRLPQSLDLSRLNIYAPHIKRLIISNIHVDEYENWGIFLTCTQHIDLLPNLDTLYLPVPEGGYHPGDAERIEDSVNWIHAFLSASLKTLVLAPLEGTAAGYYTRIPWLKLTLFKELITYVVQKCPHLRSLSILPTEIKQEGPDLQSTSTSNSP